MAKNLVIVESPAKAKTIEKFLGKEFKVASSFGHIADLPSKELGVEVKGDFSPKYIISDDKKKVVRELKLLSSKAETVWLASDEDREGEAIAWHLFNQLSLDSNKTKRIVFHEITKTAILKAIEKPRDINEDLVNAQQARRVLDRLVGYELSPLLWSKVKGGLSAGRVQSVAVRLIVEREREIQKFVPKETFKTKAVFETSNNKRISSQVDKSFNDQINAEEFLQKNIDSNFFVSNIEKHPGKKSPTPPFTTSTLQQEASRKLYFSVSKTMTVAQKLYESGLITYMRTDSVNLSEEAKQKALKEIKKRYGFEYAKARIYKNKNKSAQQAHEAIRPTEISKTDINGDKDQARLYDLIWKRTIASQMSDAILEKTQLSIKATSHDEKFVSNGEILTFDGFLKIYLEGTDDELEETKGILPVLKKGDSLNLKSLISLQRFSKPPFRFSEASLVKKLEELGIGRPSTYAPTVSTVQNRGYVDKGLDQGIERKYIELSLKDNVVVKQSLSENTGSNKGKLIPTNIGNIVNDFLVNNFKNIVDYNFTAEVEQSFDRIASGNKNCREMLKIFYSKFHETVDYVKLNAKYESGERILGNHPENGRVIKVRLGKFGPLVQIGNVGDEVKPQYASLGPEHQLEKITLDEALDLFKLPKELGNYLDKSISINIGRFGPYIKYDKMFVSIPKGISAMEVDYETSINLIEEKIKANAPIYYYKEKPVTKGVGRFGPFIKWDNLFVNVSKVYDFDNLLEMDVIKLIEEKIKKDKDRIIINWPEENIRIEKGRWGKNIIIKGKLKINLPKEINDQKISLKEAKDIISKHQKNKGNKRNIKK